MYWTRQNVDGSRMRNIHKKNLDADSPSKGPNSPCLYNVHIGGYLLYIVQYVFVAGTFPCAVHSVQCTVHKYDILYHN